MLESLQVAAVAGPEVVQNPDLLRDVLIVLDDVGSDEPGSAGDENFHGSMTENRQIPCPVVGGHEFFHF